MIEDRTLEVSGSRFQVLKLSDDPTFNPDIKMDFNPIADEIKELKYEDIDNHDFIIDEKDDNFFVMTDRFKKQLMKIDEIIKCNIPVFIEGPTGTAKTKSIRILNLKAKKDLIILHLNSETQTEDLIGRFVNIKNTWDFFSFQQGPFIDAFVNGKWLLIDEIYNASQDILQFIKSALNNQLITIDNGKEIIQYKQHAQFRLIVTQNIDNIKYILKPKKPVQQFLLNFKHIQFTEINKDELFEIATKICEQYNYSNNEIIQNLIDFHYEWSHRPDIIESSYIFTIRDISNVIKLLKNTKHPLNVIMSVYGSRLSMKTSKIMRDLIKNKYKHLDSKLLKNNFTMPKEFPPCFNNQSLLNTLRYTEKAFQNHQHILLIGTEGSGLTQVARWIAKYYSTIEMNEEKQDDKLKNHEYFFVCTPKTKISDLIGKLIPAPKLDDKIDVGVWKNGPLTKAIKNGELFVLDSLDYAPFEISEKLISLMKSHKKFNIPENPYESQININPKFRLIITANKENLSSLSPALLSSLNVIYMNSQINNIKINKEENKKELIQFLFNKELDESMKSKVQSDLIDELVNSIDIEKYSMSQVSMICKAAAKFLPYCDETKPKEMIDFIKKLLDSNCQKFTVPHDIRFNLFTKKYTGRQSYNKCPFYYENSNALSELMAQIIACSIVGLNICLKGPPELGKASMAVAFSEKALKSRDKGISPYQYFSFNEESTVDDIFGAFWIDKGIPKKSKGPLYHAIENGQVFVSDATNLADDKVIQSLVVALKNSSESKVVIPRLGKSVSFHKDFFFIACQNANGKELPMNISKKLRIFEFPTPTLDDLKENCKDIAQLELKPQVVSQDDAEKLAIFIDKINNSNIQHIAKWSMRNVRILFRRISDSSIKQNKFLGFSFIHHLLFYILSRVPDSISKTIFDDIMNILVECFGITDEEKTNLKQCYYENPIIENSGDVCYLKKGNIGVLIPQHIVQHKIINDINLHSLWNTLFKILIANDNEPLLISGNSGFKTFLASLILPDAQIVTLHQDTQIDQLFGSIIHVHNSRLEEFYLEQFCRILHIKDKYNDLRLVLNGKKSISSLNNTEPSKCERRKTDNELLNEFCVYLRNCVDDHKNSIPSSSTKLLKHLIDHIEGKVQYINDFTTVFKPGLITDAILEQSPLILKDFSNLTPAIFERFDQFDINPSFTLKEDICNTLTSSNNANINYSSDKFRIISLLTPDSTNILSHEAYSKITVISCPEYSESEVCDVINSISLSMNFTIEPVTLLKSFTEKYRKEFEKNVPFLYLTKILQIIHLLDNFNISIEEKLTIAIFRTLCESTREVSEKIKIIKILDEVFDKNITQTFTSLIDETCEEKVPFTYQKNENINMVISNISKLSITYHLENYGNYLYFSRPFIDMIDAIFTGIAIHYPIILDGITGKGKHSAVEYVASILGYKVVTFRITSETTAEDLFGKNIPKVLYYKLEYDFIPSQIQQIISSDSDDKTIIVLEGISQASSSLLNWISPLFDISKQSMLLPNGDTIQKGNYNIIALETISNKLPKSFKINSIYHSLPEYSKDQINGIALKIFSDKENLTKNHKTFMNYFHVMSEFFPKSNTKELYSLNDINKYRMLTNGAVKQLNMNFYNMVFLNKLSDEEDKSKASKLLGKNITNILCPKFSIEKNKFYASFSSKSKISLNIDNYANHCETPKQVLKKVNSMTLDQRQCLLFLMCSVLHKQPAIISGKSFSGKSYVISNFAKLLGKKLVTIHVNSHTGISSLMSKYVPNSFSERDIEEIRQYLLKLCNDSDLKHEIEQILDIHNTCTWSQTKLKMIEDKVKLSKNQNSFIRELYYLGRRTESIIQEDSPFIKAMREGSWVLIDNIEYAPKGFLEKLIPFCSKTPTFNFFECGPENVYSHFAKSIHDDFRLFIIYNPDNIEQSRRISPEILNNFSSFVLHPIDHDLISSGIVLNGLNTYANKLWENLNARLANVHEFAKQHLDKELAEHSFLHNINIIQNYFVNYDPKSIAKMVCKCIYINYCGMSKAPAEFYKQLQSEFLKTPESSFLRTLKNYDMEVSNDDQCNVLKDLYELQINKNKSEFNFKKFLEKIDHFEFQDTYALSFHIKDTLNQLNSELMNKFGDLLILNQILNQISTISKAGSVERSHYGDRLNSQYFLINNSIKHSLFQIHLLQKLIEEEKLIDFSPSCFCSLNSRKSLSTIANLLGKINFKNMLKIIEVILQDRFLYNESSIFLNCKRVRESQFSKILILLPMLIRLHQNEIPFTINDKDLAFNKIKSDYLVKISVSEESFELKSDESKIFYQSKQVTINESGFYSYVYHLIDCIENKIPADFDTNIKNIDFPQINDNNHPLYDLYLTDNQSKILKLFKSAILFGDSIDDDLSVIFGQDELKLMSIFNIIWNTIETDENDLIIKMIDEFIDIESNLFSLDNYNIETKERLDILASIFYGISKIELFNICEKQIQDNKNDQKDKNDKNDKNDNHPRINLLEILNKMKSDYKIQYYKIEAEKGNVKAMNAYAWMLEYGIGIKQNIKEAYHYYNKAANEGSEIAMNNLIWNPYYDDEINDGQYIKDSNNDTIKKVLKIHIEQHYKKDAIKEKYKKYNDQISNKYFSKFFEETGSKRKSYINYYKMAAEKGNGMAVYLLAKMIEDQGGNSEDALKLYKQAAEKGVRDAMYRYGQMLENGEGIPMNKEEACKYYKMAADKGNKDALWKYCHMIRNGEGVPMNKEEAFKYYKAEAENEHVEAMKMYAWLLENGEGAPINKEEASKYYKKAADKGDINAIFKYGTMLEYGEGVWSDKDQALNNYETAKSKNLYASQMLINPIWNHFFGNHQKSDSNLSYKSRYNNTNNIDDNTNYDDYYIYDGLSKDDIIHYYEMAAGEGDQYAMYKYNWMSEYDELCAELSEEEKYPYYIKFANAGDNLAMYKCGEMFEKGEGVKQDKRKACEYYKNAADKGDRNAIYKYAQMLEKGEGVLTDEKQALKYYKDAAYKGDRNAMFKCACLLLRFGNCFNTFRENDRYDDKQKIGNALSYFKKAADEGDRNAMVKYPLLLEFFEMNQDYRMKVLMYQDELRHYQNQNKTQLATLYTRINNYSNNLKEYIKTAKDANRNRKEVSNSTSDDEISRQYTIVGQSIDEMKNKQKCLDDIKEELRQIDEGSMAIYGKICKEESIHKAIICEILAYYKLAADEGNAFAINKIIYNFFELWGNRNTEKITKEKDDYYIKKINEEFLIFYKRNIEKVDIHSLPTFFKESSDFKNMEQTYLSDEKYNQDYYIKADKGDVNAMIYSFKLLFEKDDEVSIKEAYSYMNRIADESDMEMMYKYGLLLEKGEVVEMNKEKACCYFNKSGHMGYINSLVRYGLMLCNGEGTKVNKVEAFHHFKVAAEYKNTDGMYNAGMMLYYSDGVPKDQERAFRYFEEASILGHIDSMYQYAVYVEECHSTYYYWKEGLRYSTIAYEKRHQKSYEYVMKFSYYILCYELINIKYDKLRNQFDKLKPYDIDGFKSVYNEYMNDFNKANEDYKYIKDHNWTINDKLFHPDLLKTKLYTILVERMEFIKKYEVIVIKYKQIAEVYVKYLEEKKKYIEIEYSKKNWSVFLSTYEEAIKQRTQSFELNPKFYDLGPGSSLLHEKYYPRNIQINYKDFCEYLLKAEYELYCDVNFEFLEKKKKLFEFESSRYNYSVFISIHTEITIKIEKLSLELSPKYDKMSSYDKSCICNEYKPNNVIKKFKMFSDTLLKSEYEIFCETKYLYLETKKRQVENTSNRSVIVSVQEELSVEMESFHEVYSRYDKYIKTEYYFLSITENNVQKKYKAENVYINFIKFYDSITSYVVNIDINSICVDYDVNNDIALKVIESFKTLNNKDQTSKIMKHLFDPEPFSYPYDYPDDVLKVQENYWENSSIYVNPLYSDDHPPIICNDEKEFDKILNNIYHVPKELEKVIGCKDFIKNYSIKYTQILKENKILIRSPQSIGIQRNQDPKSLYNLVITRELEITSMYMGLICFFIEIKNPRSYSVEFCIPKGTIISLPIGQQPMFICKTYREQIKPNSNITKRLDWCCMDKNANRPICGFKLTPFIYVVPSKYDFGDSPFSDIWWDKIQPDISYKISKTSYLWTVIQERSRIQIIPRPSFSSSDSSDPIWNYLPVKNGGIIQSDLFNILDRYRNDEIQEIHGVVRRHHWAKNTKTVAMHTNQFALVINIRLSYDYSLVIIEKADSGLWEGGYACKNEYFDFYTYNDFKYYADYDSIECSGIKVGQIINGIRSDSKFYNSATYNSQDSRQFLLGTLGISIPTFHSGSLIIPSLHDLINY